MNYDPSNTISALQSQLRSLLQPELGTFQNKRPAIFVEPPQSPSAGTGLHVYLSRYPKRLTGSVYQWAVTFTLFWESTKTEERSVELQKFDAALSKMRDRYPRINVVVLPFREGSFPQASLSIPFDITNYPNEV